MVCFNCKLVDKIFKLKKNNDEEKIVIKDDDNIKEIINKSFITSNFEFIDFDIDPLDDYVSYAEYKKAFYNN